MNCQATYLPIAPTEEPLPQLAVNSEKLIKLLSLDDGRSVVAAKRAAYLFRRVYKIRTLPGGVYSLYEIQAALRRAADKRVAGGAR